MDHDRSCLYAFVAVLVASLLPLPLPLELWAGILFVTSDDLPKNGLPLCVYR